MDMGALRLSSKHALPLTTIASNRAGRLLLQGITSLN